MKHIKIISLGMKDRLVDKTHPSVEHELKANIHGACIKLSTDSEEFASLWEANFNTMPEDIRPHGRIISMTTKRFNAKYEPLSKTLLANGCVSYGWIKSKALGLCADFFEDYGSEHRRYAVHGALVDKNGHGVAVIGMPGAGKTTLIYGLTFSGLNYITDDWFFVRLKDKCIPAYFSERNSYVKSDIADNWPQLRSVVAAGIPSSEGKKIIDVRSAFGAAKVREETQLKTIFLLKRDSKDKKPIRRLTPAAAMAYMKANNFCNPHFIVTNPRKLKLRQASFNTMFKNCDTWLVNTANEKPKQTLSRLLHILK